MFILKYMIKIVFFPLEMQNVIFFSYIIFV